jgi:hypothetical protein
LNAFEQYSLSCEQRNDRDAAIHARLYEMTAQARLMLEEALGFLLEQEGILLTGDEIAASRRGRAAAAWQQRMRTASGSGPARTWLR